jgi:hypothetical protein
VVKIPNPICTKLNPTQLYCHDRFSRNPSASKQLTTIAKVNIDAGVKPNNNNIQCCGFNGVSGKRPKTTWFIIKGTRSIKHLYR